jgi:DNA-binding MarR family transcriptional regulator
MTRSPTSSGALGKVVTEAGPEAREFADALMAFLSAARRTRGRLEPLFDDITVPQLVLLDAIEDGGQDGVGRVAVLAGVSQPTVTRGAGVLIDAGLVRAGTSEEDSRRRILELTEEGSRLLTAKRDVVAGHMIGAWASLSSAEQELAGPLLRHLAGVVDRLF